MSAVLRLARGDLSRAAKIQTTRVRVPAALSGMSPRRAASRAVGERWCGDRRRAAAPWGLNLFKPGDDDRFIASRPRGIARGSIAYKTIFAAAPRLRDHDDPN